MEIDSSIFQTASSCRQYKGKKREHLLSPNRASWCWDHTALLPAPGGSTPAPGVPRAPRTAAPAHAPPQTVASVLWPLATVTSSGLRCADVEGAVDRTARVLAISARHLSSPQRTPRAQAVAGPGGSQLLARKSAARFLRQAGLLGLRRGDDAGRARLTIADLGQCCLRLGTRSLGTADDEEQDEESAQSFQPKIIVFLVGEY